MTFKTFYQKTAEMAINWCNLVPNMVRFLVRVRRHFLELILKMRWGSVSRTEHMPAPHKGRI